jgi:hypothetical protein
MSSKFKTQSKFGFQPVTANSVSQDLIKIYVSDIRPQIVRIVEDNRIDKDDYALFVRFDGRPHNIGGSMVTTYLFRTLGYLNTAIFDILLIHRSSDSF